MDRRNVPLLSKFLASLHRHPVWTSIGIAAYAMIVTFPHQNVQDLVANIILGMGRSHFYLLMAISAISGGAWLTWVVWMSFKRQPEGRILFGYWIATMLLVCMTWRIFTVNNSELVHYPQYVPEGMALLALTGCAVESISWIVLTGGLDECFQYWHLHGTWGVPFDFNDVYMDLLGGAAGVLVAAAFLRCIPSPKENFARRILTRPGVMVILGITIAGLLLLAAGRMLLYSDPSNTHYWMALSRKRPTGFWFFDPTWGPNTIHTLSPIEGPLLVLATLGFFALLDRRVRFLFKP